MSPTKPFQPVALRVLASECGRALADTRVTLLIMVRQAGSVFEILLSPNSSVALLPRCLILSSFHLFPLAVINFYSFGINCTQDRYRIFMGDIQSFGMQDGTHRLSRGLEARVRGRWWQVGRA